MKKPAIHYQIKIIPERNVFKLLLYLGYAQIYWVFNGILNLLLLARFCKTLFLPEFLSNQLEILTQHSKSSQERCYYNFSKTSMVTDFVTFLC